MRSQRTSIATWVIVPFLILMMIILFSGCRLTTSPAKTTDASADYQLKQYGGMTYLIVLTSSGAAIANITKDSLEVRIRRRNELYIELANRQLQKK